MTPLKKRTNRITAAGIAFILTAGTLLHFVYEWTGGSIAAAVISAVNESIWEHIKLLTVPSVFFILIGSFTFARKIKGFVPSLAAGMYVGAFFIPTAFYTYSGITGVRHITADIAIFIISAFITLFTARHLILKQRLTSSKAALTGTVLIAIMVAATVYFTFAPPHIPLFKDYASGGYGIPATG